MFFTQEDFKKIELYLLQSTVKDTLFSGAALPLKGNETIAFVLNDKNVKASVKDIVDQLFLLGVSDFINVTTKYNESLITLASAIQLIPYRSRKLGLVITYLNESNVWGIYQFHGERINQWNNLTLWTQVIGSLIDVIPDNEDLTGTKLGNRLILSFANKDYQPNQFSGLGRVYLRKNIVTVPDSTSGSTKAINLLTQSMISKLNTIYHIQYDYDLNGTTIAIPNGCILLFDGGSVSNGVVVGYNTLINSPIIKIFNNIEIEGTWNLIKVYPEWFGAIGDGNVDDTKALLSCFSTSFSAYTVLQSKKYLIKKTSIPRSTTYCNNIQGKGLNSVLLLDGFRFSEVFNTSKLDTVNMSNFSIIKTNSYMSMNSQWNFYNYENHKYAVFFGDNVDRKSTSYSNLLFDSLVVLLDGTQKDNICISEYITGKDGSIFDNIKISNFSGGVNLSTYNKHCYNTIVSNIYGINVEVLISIQTGYDYTVENISLNNTFESKINYIGKTNPLNPTTVAGLDLVHCGGDRYILNNLVARNGVERTVYSVGSNVTATNLTDIDTGGFKFVGLTASLYSYNINIDNSTYITTKTALEYADIGITSGAITTNYWVENVYINNTKYIILSSDLSTPISYGHAFLFNSKNISIKNTSLDNINTCAIFAAFNNTNNTVVERLNIDNVKVSIKQVTPYPLLNVSTEPSTPFNILKDVTILNSYITMSLENQCTFLYNYLYTDGFYAENNSSNYSTGQVLPFSNSSTFSNVVLKEEKLIITSTILYDFPINVFSKHNLSPRSVLKYTGNKSGILVELGIEVIYASGITPVSIYNNSRFIFKTQLNNTFSSFRTFQKGIIEFYRGDSIYYKGEVNNGIIYDIIGERPNSISFQKSDESFLMVIDSRPLYKDKIIFSATPTDYKEAESERFKAANKTYKIIDEVDLKGKIITIGANSTLDFQGGIIKNGTLQLVNTKVLPSGCNIAEYITANITGLYREGQLLYDSNLGETIVWNGEQWMNSDGTLVSKVTII